MIEEVAKHRAALPPSEDGTLYEIVEFFPGELKATGGEAKRSAAAAPSGKPGSGGALGKFRTRIVRKSTGFVHSGAKSAPFVFRAGTPMGGVLANIVIADGPQNITVEGEARLRRVGDDVSSRRGTVNAQPKAERVTSAEIEAEVSAAKLRIALDERLDRTTPNWVFRVADQ